MSRIIAYWRFMAVFFEDDAGSPVDALVTRATTATVEAFARHRLLARAQADGIALYYRTNPDAVPALLGPIDARVRLSFSLHLTQPDFFDRHLPTFSSGSGTGFHLDNLDPAGAILADGAVLSQGAAVDVVDGAQIGPRRLPVRLDLTASSPTSVEAREDISGALAATANVVAPAGASSAQVQLDLGGANGVAFRVAEVPPGPVSRRAYSDDAVSDSGAAGVMDLFWETAQDTVPDPGGVVYRAIFTRR